ncbi:pirin family protein [Taibaiella lutea]|uniref:Pirin family protein n=1 Tax=Taibaiella lutea TaxID=2608001 RepID=A0A5M6CMK6_9BACT|nr:pirin family protein [Taibaiella lutea]KAA5536364.1 pirin family protein [Taibaiella lutea]
MNRKIEKVFKHPKQFGMVGDGFKVYNYIPGEYNLQRRMSPFLMLDFNPSNELPPSEKQRGVDVHPHKGFETVTIAYKGSVAHHDSSGNSGVIHPGDVQWMTAGSGILHKEYHEKEFSLKGGPFQMVQLWVNLPAKDKLATPGYQAITADSIQNYPIPDDGGVVNVIAGNFRNIKGSAKTFTPVNLWDIKLKSGGEIEFDVPANHNGAILVVEGNAIVNGENAAEFSFVLLGNEGETVNIKTTEGATLLVMTGEPINEPIASYGPFVMNTQDEIIQSIQEYQNGKFGHLE